jgi:hypothetical protein
MLRGVLAPARTIPMPAEVTPLVTPIRRTLKDLEERLASLRGYL